MISIWKLLGNTAGFAAELFSAGSSKLSCQSRYRSIYVSDYMSKLYHQWIGLRENLNRKPENVPITYGAFRFQFSLKINPLISAYISYHHMLRQRNPVGTEHWIPPALHPRWFNMGSIMIYSSSAICLNIARFFKNRINLLVLSREWMGCWGLLGLLIVSQRIIPEKNPYV